MLKLCYKPRELYSGVSLSFPILRFSPVCVAHLALGTTLKGSKAIQGGQVFPGIDGKQVHEVFL